MKETALNNWDRKADLLIYVNKILSIKTSRPMALSLSREPVHEVVCPVHKEQPPKCLLNSALDPSGMSPYLA